MQINKILICVKNPFCDRDYERMGLAKLKLSFKVIVLDCSPWLFPKSYKLRVVKISQKNKVRRIKIISLLQAKKILKQMKRCVAFDFVGPFSFSAILFFNLLKKYKIPIVVFDSGAHPIHFEKGKNLQLYKKDWSFFLKTKEILKKCLRFIVLKILPDQNPDLAMVSGSIWKKNPRFLNAKNRFKGHSFDYELSLNELKKTRLVKKPYMVYLDEKITNHEDNFELGACHPASKGKLLPQLLTIFTQIEKKFKSDIVIAGYPSTNKNKIKRIFRNRKVYINKTANLVKFSKLVLCHGSTAISYAAIFKKPVLFLTNNEILQSWYQPTIDVLRKSLDSLIFNLDKKESINRVKLKINRNAYKSFVKTFVTSNPCSKESIWMKTKKAIEKYIEV